MECRPQKREEIERENSAQRRGASEQARREEVDNT